MLLVIFHVVMTVKCASGLSMNKLNQNSGCTQISCKILYFHKVGTVVWSSLFFLLEIIYFMGLLLEISFSCCFANIY